MQSNNLVKLDIAFRINTIADALMVENMLAYLYTLAFLIYLINRSINRSVNYVLHYFYNYNNHEIASGPFNL